MRFSEMCEVLEQVRYWHGLVAGRFEELAGQEHVDPGDIVIEEEKHEDQPNKFKTPMRKEDRGHPCQRSCEMYEISRKYCWC